MGIKKAFPTFGNGNGNEKLIPKLWERESEARIPENGREREFPLTPAVWPTQMTMTRGMKPHEGDEEGQAVKEHAQGRRRREETH